MIPNSYLQYLFLITYIFIGLLPRFGAIDMANTQWILLGLTSLFHTLFNYKKLNEMNFGVIPILVIGLNICMFLSVINAQNFPEFIIESSKIVILSAVFFNAYLDFGIRKSLIKLFFILLGSMLLVEVYSILSTFRLNYYASIVEKVGRLTAYKGIGGNINIAAYSIVFKSVGLLYLINLTKSKILKLSGILILVGAFFAVALTGSRGALLSVYIVILLYFLFNLYKFYKTRKRKDILNTLYYVIPFTISTIITELVFDTLRVSYRTSEIFARGSQSRLEYWLDAIRGTMDYPLFGVGEGGWKIFSMFYNREIMRDYVVPYHAHNDFLQTFAEIGVIGGLFFLAIFLYSFLFLLQSCKENITSENKSIIFLSLAFVVYSIDSFFNFPISRPMQVAPFFVLLAIVASMDKTIFFRNKKSINIIFSSALLMLITGSIAAQYRSYTSAVQQTNLYIDYNKSSFDDPVEVIDNYIDDFPNITQTAMPIRALKAHYYVQKNRVDEAIEILKTGPEKFDNPFIGIYEAKLAHIYNDLAEYDSAFKYASIAYSKLPNNQYHAGHLLKAASELKKYDVLRKVFKNNGKNNVEGIWYYFLKPMYENSKVANISQDSLRTLSIKARNMFPKNKQLKLIFQELVYGSDKMVEAELFFDSALAEYNKGNFQKSYDYYEKAANLIPTESAYRQNMALSKIGEQDYDKALEILNFAIDSLTTPEENGRIYILRGGLLALEGKTNRACRDFIIAGQKKDSLAPQLLMDNCRTLATKYNPEF
jgi:O-antigen ligase/tetratricopeptide (TPR) repeat protein